MARVSVIIPVFNSAALVGDAIRSVFAQTYRDFEVILVDDGSEDQRELSRVTAEWAGRLTCIRQPNGGPARARNTGIARSSGELIAFLDADDEWRPDKLAAQVAYFDSHPETGLLHTAAEGDQAPGGQAAAPPRHAFCEIFHTTTTVKTLTVMVPRRVLEDVGVFDERREIHIEDWDLWLRIAARHPVGYIPTPLAYHRPGGLMSSQVDPTYRARLLVIEKNHALCALACAAHRAAPGQCERAYRHVLHRDWGYDLLNAGDRLRARHQLAQAVACAPRDARTRLLYLSTFLSERMRTAAGRVMARWRGQQPPAPPVRHPAPDPARQRSGTSRSLVHDTVYRRVRRRTIAALHNLDDGLSKAAGSRRRILFEAASPMSFAIYRPIYERLRQDRRLEFWFTANGEAWQPQEVFASVGITEHVITPAAAKWMKVEAYINSDLWDMTWLRRQTRRIHLFHGVAGKYGLDCPVDLAPAISGFDSLMFVNTDRRRRYLEGGFVPDDPVKAALVGYPKVDCLVNGSLNRGAILGNLGMDSAVPVVIYAPTWSPHSSLNSMGEEIVERLTAEGVQVLVKLHDRSYDRGRRGSGGVDWSARLARFEAHPLVRIIREADSCPFLAAADAMVSDHSSIAFEYMLLDRPIVTVDCPTLIAKAGVSPDKVEKLRSASSVVADASGTARAVLDALQHPATRSAARRKVAEELFYRPGTATDRAVALIYALIDLPASADVAAEVESNPAVVALG